MHILPFSNLTSPSNRDSNFNFNLAFVFLKHFHLISVSDRDGLASSQVVRSDQSGNARRSEKVGKGERRKLSLSLPSSLFFYHLCFSSFCHPLSLNSWNRLVPHQLLSQQQYSTPTCQNEHFFSLKTGHP